MRFPPARPKTSFKHWCGATRQSLSLPAHRESARRPSELTTAIGRQKQLSVFVIPMAARSVAWSNSSSAVACNVIFPYLMTNPNLRRRRWTSNCRRKRDTQAPSQNNRNVLGRRDKIDTLLSQSQNVLGALAPGIVASRPNVKAIFSFPSSLPTKFTHKLIHHPGTFVIDTAPGYRLISVQQAICCHSLSKPQEEQFNSAPYFSTE